MEAVGTACDEADAGVGGLDATVGQAVLQGGNDVVTLLGDGASYLHKLLDATAACPDEPCVEKLNGSAARCVEDGAELLLQEVGAVEPLVGLLQPREHDALVPSQILWVLEESPAGTSVIAGVPALAPGTRCAPVAATDFVEGLRGPLDDVERIHADLGPRAPDLHNPLYPGGRISRDELDGLYSALTKEIEEAVEDLLVGPRCRPDQSSCVVVDHHRDVPLALAMADLVDADAAQPLQPVCGSPESATMRLMIRPTVGQEIRIKFSTAVLEHSVASQATLSSKARVNRTLCRAQGTEATTTP